MRIGQVNQSNYKMFLQMLGAKNTKTLAALLGNRDNKKAGKVLSHAEMEEKLFRMGVVTERGMLVREGDNSWRKIVPVSDEVKDKIIETVRRHFLENGNGMSRPDGSESIELGDIKKEYRKNIPPSERLAVTWTLSQIELNEIQRLMDYVKSKDPSWSPGKPFDKSILLNSDFGTNTVDVIV